MEPAAGARRRERRLQISRRRWLGVAGAVVAGAGGAFLLASVGRGGPAHPGVRSAPVALTLQPSGTIPWNRTTAALYQELLAGFEQGAGVRVSLQPTPWHGNVQAILDGTAADVIADNYPPGYMVPGGDLLLSLEPLLQRDGVAESAWPAAQLAAYRGAAPDGQLRMLPSAFTPLVYAVRLADFDALGVPRPDPNWTHLEFAAAARAMTRGSGAGKRFGAVLDWYSDHIGGAAWPFRAFGGDMQDAQGASTLAAAPGLAAGAYLYGDLLWPGVATTRDLLGPAYGSSEFTAGRVSMQLSWGGLVLDNALRYRGFAWDYYAPPAFPAGVTGAAEGEFHAVAATTRHPDAAWALLRFLAADASPSGWQRGLMRLALRQPSLGALWEEWIARARATAPSLQTKRLEAFRDAALSGRAFPQQYYPRLDQQCQNLAAPSLRSLWTRQAAVAPAFARADQLVNALLARAAAVEGAQGQALATAGRVAAGGTYVAPAGGGLGASAAPAGQYARSSAGGGVWTLLGDGTAVGGTSDNTVFACLPVTAYAGEWSCRVVALTNLTCPRLSPGAGAGLMLRGDLSDDATMATLQVGSGGVRWRYRTVGGVAASTALGLAGTAPLWLKLRRVGMVWTALVSTDGGAWRQVGQATLRTGGVWLGIHCCAHNGDFGGAGYVRGVFDHLSFAPGQIWQVGDQGVPPGAGPVPAAWASGPT